MRCASPPSATARASKPRSRRKFSALLTDLLHGRRSITRSAGSSVRDLLDAGSARVQQELAGQPEVLADVLTVMGRVYQRLALTDKALPLLERALEIGRKLPATENARLAQTLNDLGVLVRMNGDAARSVALLQESLALRTRVLGTPHQDAAVTLSELGRSYDDLGNKEAAERFTREALAMRRSLLGEEHRETATSMGDLGLQLWQRGDLAGAEPLLRRSLEISRKVLGEDHPNVGSAESNLALVIADSGHYAEAEALFRQALGYAAARSAAAIRASPSRSTTWRIPCASRASTTTRLPRSRRHCSLPCRHAARTVRPWRTTDRISAGCILRVATPPVPRRSSGRRSRCAARPSARTTGASP